MAISQLVAGTEAGDEAASSTEVLQVVAGELTTGGWQEIGADASFHSRS